MRLRTRKHSLADLGTPPPPPGPADWNDEGVVLLPGFFADDVLEPYREEWRRTHGFERIEEFDGVPVLHAASPDGWMHATPHLHDPALRRVVCDARLGAVLADLVGDTMAVSLELTPWVSTTRDWHADAYLNEPEVGDWYAAVWIAVDDIHPDSGVFQYVPGSHRWPQITRETISRFYDLTDPDWPRHTEEILTPLFTREIERRGAQVVSHVPRAGDVLIWHARLLHRGSTPKVPRAYRPALIAHYSGVSHRPLMPPAVRDEEWGGWHFPVDTRPGGSS